MSAADNQNGSNGATRKAGRPPTIRTPETADRICERLANGESLLTITKDPEFPSYPAVTAWIASDSELAAKIARAREDQSDYFMDQCLSIADNAKPEEAAVAKLQIYVREKYAAKCKPKKWGDKPSEVNNNLQIHNHLHITEADLRQIQEERQKFLAGLQ